MTTKVLALTAALGNLVRFKFLPGRPSEIVGMPALIEGLSFGTMPADRAFDADHLRQKLDAIDAEAVIPAKRTRVVHILTMPTPTNGAISSKTIPAGSKSSEA